MREEREGREDRITVICEAETPCWRKKDLALPFPLSFIICNCCGVHSSKSQDLRPPELGRGIPQHRNDDIRPDECDVHTHSAVYGTAVITDEDAIGR